jgi:hypothetical protein
MHHGYKISALACEILHPQRAKIVDLKRVMQGFAEVNACCAVHDDLNFLCENLPVSWLDTEVVENKVTFNWDDSFFDELGKVWTLGEERLE